MDTHIKLSPDEIIHGSIVGILRQVAAIEGKWKHVNTTDQAAARDWQQHIEGALGEQALAKYLGVYWSASPLGARDVAGMEVRTTWCHTGRLPLYVKDSDYKVFWLVTGKNGDYTIRGWMPALYGKLDDFWMVLGKHTDRPTYCAPQGKLELGEVDLSMIEAQVRADEAEFVAKRIVRKQ